MSSREVLLGRVGGVVDYYKGEVVIYMVEDGGEVEGEMEEGY